MPSNEEEELAPLAEAYERRSTQLYEARAALAEAVASLRTELKRRHEEVHALRTELAALREEAAKQRDHAVRFMSENNALRGDVARLEDELRRAQQVISAFQGMKVVRWTAWPRSVVYRLRERGK
jgi:uncharacterized coiled-coil DUF342 family protein